MSKKAIIILYVLLTINAMRYGTYILEGNDSWYNIIMLSLNLLALISTFIYRMHKGRDESEPDMSK